MMSNSIPDVLSPDLRAGRRPRSQATESSAACMLRTIIRKGWVPGNLTVVAQCARHSHVAWDCSTPYAWLHDAAPILIKHALPAGFSPISEFPHSGVWE